MIQTTPVVNTRLEDLPAAIAAYTILDENAEYTIIINAKMSQERAIKAYHHELRHIYSGDFEKENVEEIEVTAHEKAKE